VRAINAVLTALLTSTVLGRGQELRAAIVGRVTDTPAVR